MKFPVTAAGITIAVLVSIGNRTALLGQEQPAIIFPEQRHIEIRDPSHLPGSPLRQTPPPRTVTEPLSKQALAMSLDEAIRIAIENAKTLRRLAGLNVISSGRTIYDTAIQNTQIDQAQARFDPTIKLNNQFTQTDTDAAFTFNHFNPFTETGVINGLDSSLSLQKTNTLGGIMQLTASDASTGFLGFRPPGSLDVPSVGFGYVQPLLQGAGRSVNMAPIVIAQIQTEYSFFQTKEATQELVRSVIEAYWNLVYARIDSWARRQQVEQGQEAYQRAEAQLQVGIGTAAEVAQSRSSLAGFRAALIGAEGNALQREAALRNLLFMPPYDAATIVPTTPPATTRLPSTWSELLDLAGERRPDLIELKLILEADQQQEIIANNQAMPQLNAVAGLAWNGIDGSVNNVSNFTASSTAWSVGVNFSVPLGLRQGRAALRQKQLLIASDRANLEQGMHAAEHDVATSYRNLVQYYEQYLAFKETAEASRINLEQQMADFQLRRGSLYLNVLQAITEWGNAVSSEAQSLALYNTELANMESRTGTILETHGIHFVEERFCSIGPAGRLGRDRPYPLDTALQPGANPRYPAGPAPKNTDYAPPEGTGPVNNNYNSPPSEPIPAPQTQPVLPPPDGPNGRGPATWSQPMQPVQYAPAAPLAPAMPGW